MIYQKVLILPDIHVPDQDEVWKVIPNCGEWYDVSNKGRIRSWIKSCKFLTKREEPRILALHPNCRGYLLARLHKHNPSKVAVHKLVAEAFIGPRPQGLELNHINGIKSDNRPENLEYITHGENLKHAYRLGLRIPWQYKANRRMVA